MTSGSCHHCGKELEFPDKVFRSDTCPGCGSDIHCCLNCENYDEGYSDQCKEPQAERQSVKDRRNFCDYFKLANRAGKSSAADRAADAKRKLEELFSKK
jgi:hypothetical protein